MSRCLRVDQMKKVVEKGLWSYGPLSYDVQVGIPFSWEFFEWQSNNPSSITKIHTDMSYAENRMMVSLEFITEEEKLAFVLRFT